MSYYLTFGEPVNAAPAVARNIAFDNAQSAWARLGQAYASGRDEVTMRRLLRSALARQKKLDRAYNLKFGEYMRIQAVA
jgi:hypothetical protein